jgi:mono/diheme cytochrome c family protein
MATRAIPIELKRAIEITILVAAALVTGAAAIEEARSAEANATSVQRPAFELIPGADRMTAAERDTYRRRMAAAPTGEAREKIRAEYAAAAGGAPSVPVRGDPERGAQLHRGCFGCHGIERYVSPVTYAAATFFDSVLRASGLSELPPAEPARFKGRVKSLAALREGVVRRNDYMNPKLSAQDIEDVVAYLNVTYYRFPE